MSGTVWHDDGQAAPIPDFALHQAALGMLSARRAMRGTLPDDLIHDVALEMLLAVFLARGATVTVDRLLADAAVPPALARRWLDVTVSERLLVVHDGTVSLTTGGRTRMEAMVAAVVLSQRELLGRADH